MDDSIFSKIIKGEIPSHKVYEDDNTYAFLDIHPAQPGHTLVVPKNQVDHVWDLPDEDYLALMESVKKISLHMKSVLEVKRIGVRIEGFEVPHAHIHLIPINNGEEFKQFGDASKDPDHQALAEMAKKLAFEQ